MTEHLLLRLTNAMRRAAAVHAAALLLCVLVAGLCTSPAGGQQDAEPKTPISLAVWRYHFPGEISFLSDLTAAYERTHGRKVEHFTHDWAAYVSQMEGWRGDLNEFAPDMVIIHDFDLPVVAANAASLEGRFSADFLSGLNPALVPQGRLEGILLAVPWMAHPRALFYRADLLRAKGLEVPNTPEDLAKVAQAVAAPPELYGLGLPGRPGGGAPDMLLTVFRALGGKLFNDTGRLAIAEQTGHDALTWWADLLMRGGTQPEALTWSDSELSDLFLQGRLAMVVERPWFLRQMLRHPPPFEFGVAPVPRVEGGTSHVGVDCIMVFDTARDIDGCCHFIEYALGRDPQRALAGLGVPTVRTDMARFLPQGDEFAPFADSLQHARAPSASTWGDVAPLLAELLQVTLSGRMSVPEALEAIDVQVLDEPEDERLGLAPVAPKDLRPPTTKPEE